ncbi:MAG: NAD+ synthase [Candidatus Cloacimonadales bacterium]
MRKIDLNLEIERITAYIQTLLLPTGLKKLIIGLSGGIDSALSAALAVKAVGKENVIAVMLPYKDSSDDSYNDALTVAEWLDIKHYKVDITPMVDAYFSTNEQDANSLRRGNFMARMRMIVLYDFSAKYGGLVVGTGNLSEVLTGYFTQYGDNACAFEPLGHLYKTEVWEMSRILGIPEVVIDKCPTADLWSDQTDEQEMGICYQNLDEVLYQMFELKLTKAEMLANNITAEEIKLVEKLYRKSAFKRVMPPMLEELD